MQPVTNRSDAVTQPTASPTLDALFKRESGAAAGCAGAGRSLNKQRVTGQRAEAPDLRAGRPHDLGAGGAFHRDPDLPANSVIAVQLPNTIEFALTVLAAYPRRPGRRGAAAVVAAGGTDHGAQPHRRAGDRDRRARSTASSMPISP